MRTNNYERICPVCGTKFVLKQYKIRYKNGREIERYSNRKYCSSKCHSQHNFLEHHEYYQNYWLTRPNLWQWKKERKCLNCDKVFIPNIIQQVGCSKECGKRISRKKWKKEHRDEINAWQRQWFRSKRLENAKETWKEIPCRECKKMFLPNFGNRNQQVYCSIKCREKRNRRWENKTEYAKAKKRYEVGERKHRIRANGGKFTFQEWEQMKKDYNFTCPICKRKEPEIKLVRDHIFPIVKGGRHCKENIQPLCISCNCRKHDN